MKVIELPPTKDQQAKNLAKDLHNIYAALVEAGFTAEQAMSMMDRILDRMWYED